MAAGAQVLQVEQLTLPENDADAVSDRPRDHDDVLLAAIARSDERAFRELVERHIDRAYALALRILRNAADAEDVVQDTPAQGVEAARHLAVWQGAVLDLAVSGGDQSLHRPVPPPAHLRYR